MKKKEQNHRDTPKCNIFKAHRFLFCNRCLWSMVAFRQLQYIYLIAHKIQAGPQQNTQFPTAKSKKDEKR